MAGLAVATTSRIFQASLRRCEVRPVNLNFTSANDALKGDKGRFVNQASMSLTRKVVN
jgi:hypothetical protein